MMEGTIGNIAQMSELVNYNMAVACSLVYILVGDLYLTVIYVELPKLLM